MNGILMRSRDLLAFKQVLQRELTRLPPDLIYQGWLENMREQQNRTQYIYRDNLLDHIGSVSSFSFDRPERPQWPKCFEPLASVWSFAAIERFDLLKCAKSDISPCPRVSNDHYDQQQRWNTNTTTTH
jgi:hypothetical protein